MPGGGPIIGEAQVGLSLNDSGLQRELKAAEAQLRAAMERMDHERATAKVKVDLSSLKKDLKEAEGLVNQWEQKVEQATTKGQTRYRQTQLANAKASRDAAKQAVDAADQELKAHRSVTDELRMKERELAAVERYEKRVATATKRAADEEKKHRRTLEDSNGALDRWVRSLTGMTARIGPFTAKLGQFARVFTLLGPAIVGVAGNVGALAGVLGSGLVGALGVGAAGLTGFALAAGGIALVMKPLVTQYKAAKTASTAYNNAVLHYGKSSKQAKTAQAELNSTLKGLSPPARQAFTDLGKLSAQWKKLTAPARSNLMEGLASGIKTVEALMPSFAARTNQATSIISNSFQGFMRDLRSGQGKSLMDNIFGGFNRTLPSILSGLQSLSNAFLRTVQAFSRPTALGSIGNLFKDFATKVEAVTSNTSAMNHFADTTTDAFKKVIAFGGQAGRVFAAFLRAGAGPGGNLLDRMTGGLKKLADQMSSTGGQRGLAHFFQESADTAHRLWTTIKPLGQLFFQMATVMRPFTNVALSVTSALTKMAEAATHLAPIRGMLQGLFLAFSGASIAKRIGEAATSMGLLKKAAAGVTEEGGLTGIASVLGRINPGLAALTIVAGGLGALLLGVKSPSEQLAAALEKLHNAADDARNSYDKLKGELPQLADNEKQAGLEVKRTAKELKDSKKGTLDHKQAVLDHRDAIRQDLDAMQARNQAISQETKSVNTEVSKEKAAWDLLTGTGKKVAAQDKKIYAGRMAGSIALANQTHTQQMNTLVAGKMSAEYVRLNHALNDQAAAGLSIQRSLKGWLPLAGQAEQKLGALARIKPNVAETIAVKYKSPTNVGDVAQAAQAALQRGVKPQEVIRIIADTKSAEAAIQRLNSKKVDNKVMNVIANVAGAIGGIAHVNSIRVAGKTLGIAANIGGALAGYSRVSGLSNIARFLAMAGIDNGARGLWGSLNALGNIVKTFTVIKRVIGGGKATGGEVTHHDRMMGAAAADAAAAPSRQAGRSGSVTRPTLLTGEEAGRKEYVIATNPAYRATNVHYLAEAARDLGLNLVGPEGFLIAAAKGRRPRADTRHGRHVIQRHARHMPVPKATRFGAVPEDKLQTKTDHAESRYQGRKTQLDNAQADLRRAKSAKEREKAQHRVDHYAKGLDKLYRTWQVDLHDLNTLKAFNAKLSRWDTQQETERQKMDNASKTGNSGAYNTARSSRGKILHSYISALQRAIRLTHDPDLKSDLQSKLATAQGDKIDTTQATFSTQEVAGPATLDDYLKALGLTGRYNDLQAAFALAQVDTPADLSDDHTAAGNISTFLEGVLSRARAGHAPSPVITDIANTLRDARSQVTDLSAPSQDEQAINDQIIEQARLYRLGQSLNTAFSSAAGGPGDLGAGGSSAASAGGAASIVQNVYTLHPGDPQTLLAIGNAAVAGFGYQGSVRATRLVTGY